MKDIEQIAIIQDHVRSLRNSVDKNSDSQRGLFRMALIGLGAVFVLRRDIELDDLQPLLPFVPLLAMGIYLYWITELATLYRAVRSLAESEQRINRIAGEKLITYEVKWWEWRVAHFGYPKRRFVCMWVLSTLAYYSTAYFLLSHPTLSQMVGFRLVYYSAAALLHAVATFHTHRVWIEFRTDVSIE